MGNVCCGGKVGVGGGAYAIHKMKTGMFGCEWVGGMQLWSVVRIGN